MAVLIETVREKAAGDTRFAQVSFVNNFSNANDTIASVVIAEVTTTDLTLSAGTVNTEKGIIEDKPVRIGAGVLFSIAGGTANTLYKIKLTATTVAGEIITKVVQLLVKSDDGT